MDTGWKSFPQNNSQHTYTNKSSVCTVYIVHGGFIFLLKQVLHLNTLNKTEKTSEINFSLK